MVARSKKVYEVEEEEEEEEEESDEEAANGRAMGDDDDDDDDDDDEYDEEEHELEKAALLQKANAATPVINNHAALRQKLTDIVLGGGKKIPWIENFTVLARTTAESLVENVDDDLKRELAFYDIALAGVKDCQEMCRSSGVSYLRPPDYYAEMVKTDDHMLKVKKELMSQAAKIEASELRRKQREAKKFGKAMQVERNVEKHKHKKDDLESIKKWRKGRESGGAKGGAKEEEMLEKSLSKSAGGKKRSLNEFIEEKTGRKMEEAPRKSHKRLLADKKYGRGGKAKTLSKRNTFESAHDMSSFNARKNNSAVPGLAVKKTEFKGKKGGGPDRKRPGKESRNKQHSRRK